MPEQEVGQDAPVTEDRRFDLTFEFRARRCDGKPGGVIVTVQEEYVSEKDTLDTQKSLAEMLGGRLNAYLEKRAAEMQKPAES